MIPDTGRKPDRRHLAAALLVLVAAPSLSAPALAFTGTSLAGIGLDQLLWMVVTLGSALAAVLAFRLLMGTAKEERLAQADRRIDQMRAALDRAEALLASDDQKTVIWDSGDSDPMLLGSLPERVGAPFERAAFLAGDWLHPDSSAKLAESVARLRRYGQAFQITVRSHGGAVLEVVGRTSGTRALARFRELTGERRSFAELKEQAAYVVAELSALRALVETLPMPIWRRNRLGRLAWVNSAYAASIGAEDPQAALRSGRELLTSEVRGAIREAHRAGEDFHGQADGTAADGARRFQIHELMTDDGSIGVAIDVSQLDSVRDDLARATRSYASTLDQLTAAIALFDGERRLRFCNAAYRALWDLPQDWLDGAPEEAAILDQLRAERKLPEQANYRDWRSRHLAAYGAAEPHEEWWHLPDGRSLRVATLPNQDGGLTYVFENVTEQLSLESRLEALSRLQGETLDHLREGVAVFASDGRLRLFNPVFAEIWHLSPSFLRGEPHISEIGKACSAIFSDMGVWADIGRATTELERRTSASGQMERPDGSVIDFASVALPDGMTMVTFADVTDTARVQKVLQERNEALEAADRLKTDFIQHVSYELRSPLTSIIGFAEMVSDETIGSLNAKQREYMDHIAASSSALLAIVNDILDLATVDAGIMALDIGEVDARGVANAAVDGLKDRLEEQDIELVTHFGEGVSVFHADEHRVRQILFNLLSNAVRFSHARGKIELTVEKSDRWIAFAIRDEGMGIPADMLPNVFAPFEGRGAAGRRRGPGLGLSIVKSLVELHGGTVDIQSAEGVGTTVTVRFPELAEAAAVAAE